MDLLLSESIRLTECERIIEKGLQTFVEVGNALLEIRDSRLYRQDFKRFEDYLKERWSMSRSYAHRIIEASQFSALLPNGNKPTSEGQARAMMADVVKKAAVQARSDTSGTIGDECVEHWPKPKAKDVEAATDQLKAPLKPDDSPITIKKLTKVLVKELREVFARHGLGCGITSSTTEGEAEEVIVTECGWRNTAIVDRGKITFKFYRERNRREEFIGQEAARKWLMDSLHGKK
jgi:hypothetical protein